METIKYDKGGRMLYNPEFHARQGLRWTSEEDDYLMRFYNIDGLKMLSYALEKTEASVQARYKKLKTRGYKIND